MYCDRFANLYTIRDVTKQSEAIYIPFVEVHEAMHI